MGWPVDAVDHLIGARLLGVGARLDVGHRATVEPGGDLLLLGSVGQQVAGKLLDGELVERHVGVQRLDHPIAEGPNLPQVVALETVRIGVPRQVEPRPRPALAELRRRQQPIDQFVVGFGTLVRRERGNLVRRRRQPNQVQRDAANERRTFRLRRRRQPFFIEPTKHKRINGIGDPRQVAGLRNSRPRRRLIGPMGRHFEPFRPVGARVDPAANQFRLLLAQRLANRRHDLVVPGRQHGAAVQFAVLGVARHDR